MEFKFKCQESCGGKCCTNNYDGKSSFTFLTEFDLTRLEIGLFKDRNEFALHSWFDFTRTSEKKIKSWHLKSVNGACIFFKEGKCIVYESRPEQCRTYPHWPEHLNEASWKELAIHCPGIGKE